MRNIRKGKSPDFLEKYRREITANYEDFRDKDELLARLVDEQRGLCCYCLSQIFGNTSSSKIEHWYPQNPPSPAVKESGRDLDYTNLLAVCKGGEGKSKAHCDRSKKNSILNRNPANPSHDVETPLHYLANGTVNSKSDPLSQDLEKLNLNCQYLVTQRKYAISTMNTALNKRIGRRKRAAVQSLLDDYDGTFGGTLKPYCQVAIYFLRKKLKRG
jgi:uncharacterized protein (TIGR02646 family)